MSDYYDKDVIGTALRKEAKFFHRTPEPMVRHIMLADLLNDMGIALNVKERTMNATERLTKTLAKLQEEMDQVQSRIDLFGNMPVDSFDEGDVVAFRLRFKGGGLTYSYAAVKIDNGMWALTGSRHAYPISWGELIEVVAQENVDRIVDFVACTQFVSLLDEEIEVKS